jgi:hypothetical protein
MSFFDKCGQPSDKFNLSPESLEIDYFGLFFTPSLLIFIVFETNKYATEIIQRITNVSVKQKLMDLWKPITVDELKCFIGKK